MTKSGLTANCDHVIGYNVYHDDWGKPTQDQVRFSGASYYGQKGVYLHVRLNFCDECGEKIDQALLEEEIYK